MDVRFCEQQESLPRGKTASWEILQAFVLRALRSAPGESFFLLTSTYHGCPQHAHESFFQRCGVYFPRLLPTDRAANNFER